MTCIRCFQKIAQSIWEKSCKGKPQAGMKRERRTENFCVSSGLGRVLPSPWPFWGLLPSSRALPSPQAGPRLSLLWRLVGGTCVSRVFVERRLPAPKAWMPSSDPRGGVAGGGCLCACLPSWPAPGAVRPAALGSDSFPETGTFPLKACFLTTRLSRAQTVPRC